jgi:hypothetical protein
VTYSSRIRMDCYKPRQQTVPAYHSSLSAQSFHTDVEYYLYCFVEIAQDPGFEKNKKWEKKNKKYYQSEKED